MKGLKASVGISKESLENTNEVVVVEKAISIKQGERYGLSDFKRECLGVDGEKLWDLLKFKKNLILQGSPGVGKTFSARRLCYYAMGVKDDSHIKNVQFHSSYSYESFIVGLFPKTEGGFELKTGVLYDICEKALAHPNEKWFLIIDEINRGNTSSIFGEIFSLMEKEHRGETMTTKYEGINLTIPPNLYIIGTMNTADRGLIALDYALRRRFSFYTLRPAYPVYAFNQFMGKYKSMALSEALSNMVDLNKEIAEDEVLGEGFEIGHSYWFGYTSFDNETVSNILQYEIFPLIEEYWFDKPDKISKWKVRLGIE